MTGGLIKAAHSQLAALPEADRLWLHRFVHRHGLPERPLRLRQSALRLLAWAALCSGLTAVFTQAALGFAQASQTPGIWVCGVLALITGIFSLGFALRLRNRHEIELSAQGWQESGCFYRWADLKRLTTDERGSLELRFGKIGLRPALAGMPLSARQFAILASFYLDLTLRGTPADFVLQPETQLPVPPRWHAWRHWLAHKLRWTLALLCGLSALFIGMLHRGFPDDPALLTPQHGLVRISAATTFLLFVCFLLGPFLAWLGQRLESDYPKWVKAIALIGCVVIGVIAITAPVWALSTFGWMGCELWRFFFRG